MASHGKKKTTMAKLNREARLRERRLEKKARKVERKQIAARGPEPDEAGPADGSELIADPQAELIADPQAELVADQQAE